MASRSLAGPRHLLRNFATRTYPCMPQLTLFADPTSKTLGLSPTKTRSQPNNTSSRNLSSTTSPKTPSSSSRIESYTKRGSSPNLWELHHIQEDMAAANKRNVATNGSDGTQKKTTKDAEGGKGENKKVVKDREITEKEQDIQDEVEEQDREGDKRADKANAKGEGQVDGKEMKGQPTNQNKRSRSPEGGGVAGRDAKKHKNAYEIKGKVATAEAAAKVDADPPLDQLTRLQNEKKKNVERGESVVYWMRMEDLRIEDNTALTNASECAEKLGLPLLALFVISVGDYKMHDRSPKKIDFILRNLKKLKSKFDELNIPLHIYSNDRRLSIPKKLVTEVFPYLKTTHVFANIEYEVDELRRDIATIKIGRDNGIDVVCVHDRLVVPPGKITSKQGKPMSVFSPWQRAWARVLEEEPHYLEISPTIKGNDKSIRSDPFYNKLFTETSIPDSIPGFEVESSDELEELWPSGIQAAKDLLDRFLHTKPRKSQLRLVGPLTPGAVEDKKNSRVQVYQTGRNLVDGDNSSRLSPYLAAGVISGRQVLQEARKLNSKGKLESGRDTGVGMWVMEVSWRDFYNHVMATWPRISMGRPFLEKFADVQWETSEELLQAWKDGKTGFPIVDAAMRACKARVDTPSTGAKTSGWMENRVRMIAACFLVKDLMLDWRLGEKYFMESFVDGDLAANNGGWQWTASTGTDPQPYFRIFNPLAQSEKCDPNGDYIRYWVPELKNLKGKAIHDPFHNMPKNEFKKLGYPEPIVDHKKARERALFRYKNVGEKEDGT